MGTNDVRFSKGFWLRLVVTPSDVYKKCWFCWRKRKCGKRLIKQTSRKFFVNLISFPVKVYRTNEFANALNWIYFFIYFNNNRYCWYCWYCQRVHLSLTISILCIITFYISAYSIWSLSYCKFVVVVRKTPHITISKKISENLLCWLLQSVD